MSDMDYGSWALNHPVRAILIFATSMVTGGLLGTAAAWALAASRILSPDDVAAGVLAGTGGSVLGAVAALVLLSRIEGCRE